MFIKIYLLNYSKNLLIIFLLLLTIRRIVLTQTINEEFTTTSKPNSEFVDQIEKIDATSTQLIIITTKIGSSETMKLSIQVIDIQTGFELPPINITGILLILTRGEFYVGKFNKIPNINKIIK